MLVEELGMAGDAVRLGVDGLERVLRQLLEAVRADEVVWVESLAKRVDAPSGDRLRACDAQHPFPLVVVLPAVRLAVNVVEVAIRERDAAVLRGLVELKLRIPSSRTAQTKHFACHCLPREVTISSVIGLEHLAHWA